MVYWYHPALTGRPVIFVVDHREYDTYKTQINQAVAAALVTEQAHAPAQVSATKPSKRFAHDVWSTKVYVMGCAFTRNGALANDQQVFGFGLNRFCAQQFAATNNIPLYWMVDDNVVHVAGIPQDLTRVEALLERDNLAALSFNGAAQQHIVGAGNSKRFDLCLCLCLCFLFLLMWCTPCISIIVQLLFAPKVNCHLNNHFHHPPM